MKDNSMGFLGWLTLMLIGFKLAGIITWHWGWVFAPVWIPFALMFVGAIIVGTVRGLRQRNRKGESKV